MADSIKLSIISGFDATGVKQAASGVADVARSADKGTQGMRQAAASASALSSAMGQGSGGLSAAARGLGAVLGGLAAGPIGLLAAGIAAIIGTFQHFKNALKETREEFDRMVQDSQKTAGDRVVEKFKREIAAIDAEAKALRELTRARGELKAAEKSATIAQVDRDQAERVKKAASPDDKEAAKLAGEIERAKVNAAGNEAAAQAELDQATRDLAAARAREAAAYRAEAALGRVFAKSGSAAKVENQGKWTQAKLEAEAAKRDTETASIRLVAAQENLAAVLMRNTDVMAAANEASMEFQKALAESARKAGEAADRASRMVSIEMQNNANLQKIAEKTGEQERLQGQINAEMGTYLSALRKLKVLQEQPIDQWAGMPGAPGENLKDRSKKADDRQEMLARAQAAAAKRDKRGGVLSDDDAETVSRKRKEGLRQLSQKERQMLEAADEHRRGVLANQALVDKRANQEAKLDEIKQELVKLNASLVNSMTLN